MIDCLILFVFEHSNFLVVKLTYKERRKNKIQSKSNHVQDLHILPSKEITTMETSSWYLRRPPCGISSNSPNSIPAFLAARMRSSSTRCLAGSASGYAVMKSSASATASSFVKYWYNPSDDNIRNRSPGLSLWCRRDGLHVMYGDFPT